MVKIYTDFIYSVCPNNFVFDSDNHSVRACPTLHAIYSRPDGLLFRPPVIWTLRIIFLSVTYLLFWSMNVHYTAEGREPAHVIN